MTQYPGSQPPPPFDPLAYGTPGMPNPSPRPASVTSLAIIGIILAAVAVLCCGLTVVTGTIQLTTGSTMGAPANSPQPEKSLQVYNVVHAVVSLVLWGVCLAACVGALYLKPWARRTMIVWSAVAIVWAVLELVVHLTWVGPATMDMMKQMQGQPGAGQGAPPPAFTNIMGGFMTGMAFVQFLYWAVLAVCVLLLWTRPHVKAAFEGGTVSGGGPPQGVLPMG